MTAYYKKEADEIVAQWESEFFVDTNVKEREHLSLLISDALLATRKATAENCASAVAWNMSDGEDRIYKVSAVESCLQIEPMEESDES